jgi:hypothetical protein
MTPTQKRVFTLLASAQEPMKVELSLVNDIIDSSNSLLDLADETLGLKKSMKTDNESSATRSDAGQLAQVTRKAVMQLVEFNNKI